MTGSGFGVKLLTYQKYLIYCVMATAQRIGIEESLQLFHALSDPTRLQIMELLRHGERCVCDLTEAAGAAQPRLSFHLKVLKNAGLVEDRREGRWSYYAIRPDALDALGATVEKLVPHARSARVRGCCG